MKCYECGGIYQIRTDRYTFPDPYVGPISIEGKPYYKCDKCNELLLTDEISTAIDEERHRRQSELLNEFPVGDFISVSETLQILGITRQALHKNHRIKNGFIYQTKVGNVVLYLKQSVLRFKETGDGRYPLYNSNYDIPHSYEKETVPLKIDASTYEARKPNTFEEAKKNKLYFISKTKNTKSKRVITYVN